MNTKHTPGPWQALNGGPYVTTRVDPEGEYVIAITSNTHSNVQFAAKVASLEDKANATLIARAPDLLAEVTALRATLNDAVELCETLRAERDKLRAALEDIAQRGPVPGYGSASALLLRLVGTQSTARAALGRAAP